MTINDTANPPMTGRAAVAGPGVTAHLVESAQVERGQSLQQHLLGHLQTVTDEMCRAGAAVVWSVADFHERPQGRIQGGDCN